MLILENENKPPIMWTKRVKSIKKPQLPSKAVYFGSDMSVPSARLPFNNID